MDIQLYATDEELKEFPEDKTDPDKISSPNNIHLLTSDLPRPHTDLPRPPTSLPVSTTKTRHRCKAKRSHKCKSKSNSKNPIVTHSVIQLNECLPPIQEKGSLIQMSAVAYLSDQSFSQSLGQPVVSQPVVVQPVVRSAHGWSAHCLSPVQVSPVWISPVFPSCHCCPSSCSLT